MSTITMTPRAARRTIGAHADHKTSDFFFPRVQSLESRETPWARRSPRLHSWFEIGTCALVVASIGTVALLAI